MDLRRIATIAWKRRLTFATVVVVALIASAAYAFSRPDRFESHAVLALTPLDQGQGALSADSFDALMQTYAETATAGVTRDAAEDLLDHPLPGPLDAEAEPGTGILRLTTRAEDPDEASEAAAAVATAFARSAGRNQLVDVTVVTPPEPATSPVEPRPPLIIGATGALAVLGGLLLVIALENLRRRVATPADVAELTAVPVLGRLATEPSLAGRHRMTAWDVPEARSLQEGYRGLRTHLDHLRDDELRCLLVTSAEEGQGKSVVVASLAIAFAQAGVDTVVVDADLRRPVQHRLFGLDNGRGLSTALRDDGVVEPAVTQHPNLRVVTSGPPVPDPTELLHARFRAVVDELGAHGSLVLVDSPPVLPVSDAGLMAPTVDGVLLVVDASTERSPTLRRTLDELDLVRAHLVGIVLNRDDDDPRAAYGAYGPTSTGPDPSRPAPRGRGAPPAPRRSPVTGTGAGGSDGTPGGEGRGDREGASR